MTKRKSYARIKEVFEIPNLLDIQLESYMDFLQRHIPKTKRKSIGLQEVFEVPYDRLGHLGILSEDDSFLLRIQAEYEPSEALGGSIEHDPRPPGEGRVADIVVGQGRWRRRVHHVQPLIEEREQLLVGEVPEVVVTEELVLGVGVLVEDDGSVEVRIPACYDDLVILPEHWRRICSPVLVGEPQPVWPAGSLPLLPKDGKSLDLGDEAVLQFSHHGDGVIAELVGDLG